MRRLNRLLTLFTVLSIAGCQCCALTEPYMDLVDHVSDHEGHADRFYHPGFDLTRIGRSDWPWCWCRKGPRTPVVIYDTPVTDQVFAREWLQERDGDRIDPPPAPAEEFEPDLDPTMEGVPDGNPFEGPMLENPPEPPALRPPPPPAPMPPDLPAPGEANATGQGPDSPKVSLKHINRTDGNHNKPLANMWSPDPQSDSPSQPDNAEAIRQAGFAPESGPQSSPDATD